MASGDGNGSPIRSRAEAFCAEDRRVRSAVGLSIIDDVSHSVGSSVAAYVQQRDALCVGGEAVAHEDRRAGAYAEAFSHLGHGRFGLERAPKRYQFADLVEDDAV